MKKRTEFWELAFPELNEPERAVLLLLVHENIENKDIAERLGYTRRNVKFYVSCLIKKYSVKTRADLILLYWQNEYASLLEENEMLKKTLREQRKRSRALAMEGLTAELARGLK